MAGGDRAPWVIGNHDVPRPVSRYAAGGPGAPNESAGLPRVGDPGLRAGTRRARAAALLMLALPGSAYIYQGDELGLPEVVELPDEARQDPTFRRSGGTAPGRDGCRVPLPWSAAGSSFGFSTGGRDGGHAAPWLPQPGYWGQYSVASQIGDPGSFLTLYRSAPQAAAGPPGAGLPDRGPGHAAHELAGLPPDTICFTREPGSSSPRTWARPRCRCRRTPGSCWPAIRSATASSPRTRRCGWRPERAARPVTGDARDGGRRAAAR